MSLNFSGRHFPTDIIMQALRYYLAYKLSYREIEEMFADRNIHFDHSTLNRWVIKYAPQLEAVFRKRKRRVSGSWRMDETYIKIKGRWVYYYRAVDKYGAIIDFYLSETRDEPAARAFFNKAINQHGLPEKVVIDQSGANAAALDTINIRLWLSGCMLFMIEVLAIKYLNNIVEQSHRKVKGKMHQCLGWKSWECAESTLAGVELWFMIKKGQMNTTEKMTPWEQFYSLAA
ncbi:MAG: IS6 family transposase [Shewanella sp.]|jgi:transposase-like protein|uniref:IS6 family transposase n=1 Tax=Shewanella TaxID=22 RepID=UPI0021D7E2D6|nr:MULTISPECIES: IS6 family transposase [unclassified Shewanella]MCU8033298.1 IS6 family transposase [Shewanella sp. SM71]MCU8095221.1 IS6 family transposase [Shewanella sp. SM102]